MWQHTIYEQLLSKSASIIMTTDVDFRIFKRRLMLTCEDYSSCIVALRKGFPVPTYLVPIF